MIDTRSASRTSAFLLSVGNEKAPMEMSALDYLALVSTAMATPRLVRLLGTGHPVYTRSDAHLYDVRVLQSTYGSPFVIDFGVVGAVTATMASGVGALSIILSRVSRTLLDMAERRRTLSEAAKLEAETDEIRARLATESEERFRAEQRRTVLQAIDEVREIEAFGKMLPLLAFLRSNVNEGRPEGEIARDLLDQIAALGSSGLEVRFPDLEEDYPGLA
jgi:hypothetical protein